jgi:hypothetical protein
MISINQALKEIISDSPFLEDGIYNWYINYSSFANYIKPRIEQITKKKVTISSIKMWLTKYSKEAQKIIKYKKFNTWDFYVKTNIEIIYMDKTLETLELIKAIYGNGLSKGNYLAIIIWGREISVIYDSKISGKINSQIDKKYIKLKVEELSIIWMYFEEESINENGLLYTLLKKLNFNNINVLELVSNFAEVAFLINKKDFKKSLEVLLV